MEVQRGTEGKGLGAQSQGGDQGAPCPSGHPFRLLTRAPAGSRTVGWGGGRPRGQELSSTRHSPGCSLWPQGPLRAEEPTPSRAL